MRSKTQEIEYNEDSSKNEDTSIGKAKSLTLSEHNVTINVGDENKILDAVIMPEFAYDNKVSWKSSDESIVKVSENGILTAVSNGNATITVSSEDGILTDECKVTVTDKKSERLSLNKTSIELTEIDSVYQNRECKRHSDSKSIFICRIFKPFKKSSILSFAGFSPWIPSTISTDRSSSCKGLSCHWRVPEMKS